jgi:phosphate transport system permease protein
MTVHDAAPQSGAPAAQPLGAGKPEGRLFSGLCLISTWSSVAVLAVLLGAVFYQAWGWLDWQFLTSFDSSLEPADAGILAGLWGSAWTILITILVSVPIGVGAALYLEEFGRDSWLKRLIQTNLANLAGVPSIVYGLLGLTVFVRMFGLFGEQGTFRITKLSLPGVDIPLPLGKCAVSGGLTLSLMILPVIIVASQEALRAVPPSLRHAALALGATRWQTVWHQVLPAALPGVLTGVILAVSRAIGEAAPLILVGATTFVMFAPGNIASPGDIVENPSGLLEAPFDTFTAMPIQIFNWVTQSDRNFQDHVTAAGIVVLLVVLLLLNGLAIIIRNRSQKKLRY